MKVKKVFLLGLLAISLATLGSAHLELKQAGASYSRYRVESAAQSEMSSANFFKNKPFTDAQLDIIAKGIAAGVEEYERSKK